MVLSEINPSLLIWVAVKLNMMYLSTYGFFKLTDRKNREPGAVGIMAISFIKFSSKLFSVPLRSEEKEIKKLISIVKLFPLRIEHYLQVGLNYSMVRLPGTIVHCMMETFAVTKNYHISQYFTYFGIIRATSGRRRACSMAKLFGQHDSSSSVKP